MGILCELVVSRSRRGGVGCFPFQRREVLREAEISSG